MTSSMESRTVLLSLRILGATETERVGATRSHDVDVGHTMGPMIAQLCQLERRTARGGRDSIDHPPKAHDDIANVCAGAVHLVLKRRGISVAEALDMWPGQGDSDADLPSGTGGHGRGWISGGW